MPEELSLPGIDPAPAAPAAPATEGLAAPASEQDDSSTHSASVDTGDASPSADAPLEETPEQQREKQEKRSRGGFQNRINELVARDRESQRVNQQLTNLLEKVISGVVTPQQAQRQDATQGEQPPQESQFSNWKDYEREMMRYEARQEIRRELGQRAAQEQQQRQQYEAQQTAQQRAAAEAHLHRVTGTQMRTVAAEYPDFDEVIASCPVDIPRNIEASMALTGEAGRVAYYLARNPQVIQQLASMPDVAVAYNITRIANAMRPSAASVPNLPPPGRPVGNRGTAAIAYPKDATPQQHLAWEAAQKRAAKRA
jgi:hypothetical protein